MTGILLHLKKTTTFNIRAVGTKQNFWEILCPPIGDMLVYVGECSDPVYGFLQLL